jgi:U3 small nucleolar RNA-associated protein 5
VKQRAAPLLSLKGKLDMLEAQMNLRRTMQSNARAAHADDEDDEEGVIYVEGQDESDSEAESPRPRQNVVYPVPAQRPER